MTRIVVMIEGGLLTGVFSDGCVDDIDVQWVLRWHRIGIRSEEGRGGD